MNNRTYLKLKKIGKFAYESGIPYQTYLNYFKLRLIEVAELTHEIDWQQFKNSPLLDCLIADEGIYKNRKYPNEEILFSELNFSKNKSEAEVELIDLILDLDCSPFFNYEILGWVHQNYYSIDKKEVDKKRKEGKAEKTFDEDKRTTQIFTPEHVVRYLTLNSLFNLNSELKEQVKDNEYYIKVNPYCENKNLDFKCFEPCCGCGMFLIQIVKALRSYLSVAANLNEREKLEKIYNEMLYFGDLDSESLETSKYILWIYALKNGFNLKPKNAILYSTKYGYLDKESDFNSLKFDLIITNPPYLATTKLDNDYRNYLKKNYPLGKADLFSCCMEQSFNLLKENGQLAMITPISWSYLSSFEELRKEIISNKTIISFVDYGAGVFQGVQGSVVQTQAFIIYNQNIENYKGTYFRLKDCKDKEKGFLFTNLGLIECKKPF